MTVLRENPKTYLRWFALSASVGAIAGAACALFLRALEWATDLRLSRPGIAWGLPLAGLAIGAIYRACHRDIARGTNLVLDEIHDPKRIAPAAMAPVVAFSSVLSHLFGASTGREGAAVQIGASLADQLGRFVPMEPEERRILLVAGVGASFGSAIGAPLAGILFGMEVLRVGRLRPIALFECAIASAAGMLAARALHAPRTLYPAFDGALLDPRLLVGVALAAPLFALAARGFVSATHLIERFHARFLPNPVVRPAAAGLALALAYGFAPATLRYAGLGIGPLREAFAAPASLADPLLKILFSALAIGSGFRGGEFIPLVFVGATLGSVLSGLAPAALGAAGTVAMAGVGFAATFGAAANTPLACALMATELFGWRIAPYATLGCLASYLLSGRIALYSSQLQDEPKRDLLRSLLPANKRD